MFLNILLIVAVLGGAIALIRRSIKRKQETKVEENVVIDDKTYTLEKMISFVKKRMDEITKVNLYDLGLSEEELKRRKNKKYELKKALKGCTYGDVNDKKYVKELIFDILSKEYGVDETNISKAIPFDVPSLLTAQDKFDIILYMYKKDFGYEALTQIIKKYKLAELKYTSGDAKPSYVITPEEINKIYEEENFSLAFEDKLMVVVQRIYQKYKGYSSIDEVRDMNIDGISGGVSGLPESFLSQVAQTDSNYLNQVMDHKVPRACDSIWIFFQGKSIRLAFLSFGTEAELKRVCQNIYKYNNPGFSESRDQHQKNGTAVSRAFFASAEKGRTMRLHRARRRALWQQQGASVHPQGTGGAASAAGRHLHALRRVQAVRGCLHRRAHLHQDRGGRHG